MALRKVSIVSQKVILGKIYSDVVSGKIKRFVCIWCSMPTIISRFFSSLLGLFVGQQYKYTRYASVTNV